MKNPTQNFAMIGLLSTFFRSRFGTDEEKEKYLKPDDEDEVNVVTPMVTSEPTPEVRLEDNPAFQNLFDGLLSDLHNDEPGVV
jgi:hypothetical protein